MKTPLLSDREADSANYLTAAEILKGPSGIRLTPTPTTATRT
jgi:hypothetical protein